MTGIPISIDSDPGRATPFDHHLLSCFGLGLGFKT